MSSLAISLPRAPVALQSSGAEGTTLFMPGSMAENEPASIEGLETPAGVEFELLFAAIAPAVASLPQALPEGTDSADDTQASTTPPATGLPLTVWPGAVQLAASHPVALDDNPDGMGDGERAGGFSLAVSNTKETPLSLPMMTNQALSLLAQEDTQVPPALAADPSAPANVTSDAAPQPVISAARSAPLLPIQSGAVLESAEDTQTGSGQTAFPALIGAVQARSVERPLSLPGNEASSWQAPLRQALGERLQMHSNARAEQAVIRLDPPHLGRVEITIRHEAGALTVNLSATHNEVLRQLQGMGEHLRHDLVQRHQGEVAVVVAEARSGHNEAGAGANTESRGGQRQAREQEPGRALEDGESSPAFRMSDTEERTA